MQLFENTARADGAELISGNGEFRAGKGAIVTEWCASKSEAWRKYCLYAHLLRHCGFDTTTFETPQAWQSVCDRIGLKLTGRGKYNYFVWTGPDIEVMTQANPLTGEYHDPSRRDPEPGFAGYIGASGNEAPVVEFYNLVCEAADYIKEKDPSGRSYC